VDELPGGIRRVTLPLPTRPGHVHAYLLPGDAGWTLVDTGVGLPDAKETWAAELEDAGGRVATVFVTHFHPDHVGAAADLVALGGVSSLARPGGNVTGVTHAQPDLDRKRLELLKEAVPSISRISYLFDPNAIPQTALQALDVSAGLLRVRLQRVGVTEPGQIEGAFADSVKEKAHAVLVQDSAMLARYSDRISALALRHRLPAMSQMPRFAERGGLLQYGADVFELFRRSATHVDKILKGARPGDLPVEQPTTVELIVNLKTAKALGVTIPQAIMVRADRVIQ